MLGDRFGRIPGNISPGNASAVKIIFVQIVRSGGGDTYELEFFCCTDGGLIYLNFVNNNDVGICNPFRYF